MLNQKWNTIFNKIKDSYIYKSNNIKNKIDDLYISLQKKEYDKLNEMLYDNDNSFKLWLFSDLKDLSKDQNNELNNILKKYDYYKYEKDKTGQITDKKYRSINIGRKRLGLNNQLYRRRRNKNLYLTYELDIYQQKILEENKKKYPDKSNMELINIIKKTNNWKNKKNEVLLNIIKNRINGLKICSEKIKDEKIKKFINEELEKEEFRLINEELEKENNKEYTKTKLTLEEQLSKIQFSPNKNSQYDNSNCNLNNSTNNKMFNKYCNDQFGKIFVLGSSKDIDKFRKCQNRFFVNPALQYGFKISYNNPCHKLVEWTQYLNQLYTIIIAYSKNDISGIIALPESGKFKRRRSQNNIENIDKEYNFIGFILIDYFIGIKILGLFKRIDNKKIFQQSNSSMSYFKLYDLNGVLVSIGQIWSDVTILYDELKSLFKYHYIHAYYDLLYPKYIFLSSKDKDYMLEKYKDLREIKFRTFINETNKLKREEFGLYNVNNTDFNKPLLRSIIGGSYIKKNIYNFIQKVSDIHHNIAVNYFNNIKDKEYDFYLKNYNETKYIFNIPFLHKNKSLDNKKDINFKYLLDDNIKSNCFKYKPISFGYYESYELYYSDILQFSKKYILIGEISVMPTFFEILKNNIIDIYLTKDNFRNLDEKNWKSLISLYRKISKSNFYYEKSIKKVKYDLLILNLIPDKKDKKIIYEDYIINDIKLYIKKQISNLKYLKKGGDCYFYFYTIINDDLLKLYLKVASKFENVEFFISSIRTQYKKYGGLWLKCYNYGTKNNLSNKKLKDDFYIFYESYFKEKYEWFINYKNFIDKFINNKIDYIKIKYDIIDIRINIVKNFADKNNIEINPKWKQFIYGEFYINQSFKQINYRCEPTNEFNKLFRILPNKGYGYLPYDILEKKSTNCHDGQRKLLYSEIEFYSMIKEKYDLNNILVVYVGSASGIHEPIIFDLFPELDFYLCDPNPYLIDHPLIKNKERVRINNDYYDDETWKDVIKFNKKNKNIIFICDIREDVTEKEVLKNMIQQQLWTIQLNSIAYMLKFRLPYLIEDKIKNLNINYKLPKDLKVNKKLLSNKNKNIYDFLYLKGDIYFQIYAPTMSSETRLIYIKDNKNDKFEIQNYNIENYDGNLYYFNIIDRNKKYVYKDSELVKYHILGYDDSYESVCEYFIIEKYLGENSNYDEIIRKLYEINNKIIYYSKKDIVLCPFYTMFKKKKEFIIDYEYNKNIKLKKNKAEKIINTLKNIYISVIFSLKNQYYYFGKGNILSYNNYEKQRENIKQQFQKLNKYIEEIINKELGKKNTKYIIIKDILNKTYNIFDKLLKNENNTDEINNINNKYLSMFNKIYTKII
jgi:hypothetical protein